MENVNHMPHDVVKIHKIMHTTQMQMLVLTNYNMYINAQNYYVF